MPTNHHAPSEARGEVKAIKVRKSTHLKSAQGLNLNSDYLGSYVISPFVLCVACISSSSKQSANFL